MGPFHGRRARSNKNSHQEEPRSWVTKVKSQEEPSLKLPCNQVGTVDPLTEFQDICPPGGRDAIVLYTTSLRGVRKTFSDCTKVRSLLENMRVVFQERDISMDMGYREELWKVLGWRATPPKLFIRGKYIGGAEEVIALHEQGKLKPLLPRQPAMQPGRASCGGCGGVRFIVCCECNGGRKLYDDENSTIIRCPYCNENGLVQCPFCCY
ncbi:uncharacterized protein At5g39865-like [Typha angustifolia]|uniref:uncharacterized protein At5g39865-like n=1 Tax=Typha angustifolia TaxID=59011 RepID=UPI003C2B75A6